MSIATRTGVALSGVATVSGIAKAGIATIDGIAIGGGFLTFTDDFNRPNENPLSDGGAWTNGPGALNNMQVVSNRAVTDSGNGSAYVSSVAFGPDQECTITLSGLSGVGPWVRLQANGDGYLGFLSNSTTLLLFRVSGGGVFTQLGADFNFAAVISGDTITLRAQGTTLTVYVNGVSQGNRTDATYNTGSIGIFSNGAGGEIESVTGTEV